MADILRRVGIKSPVADVYAALTTTERLAGWWTTDTRGEGGDRGDVLQFRFGAGGFDMKVVDLDPGSRVRWEVVDGPEEWIGTHVDWGLAGLRRGSRDRRRRCHVCAPRRRLGGSSRRR